MSALNVTIDPSIKGAWPEARLGCFIYTADVRAREDSLWTCLENEVAPYLKTMLETTPLAQIPNLDESRKAYKAFGKDPGRFRVSSESLYRRVRQGKAGSMQVLDRWWIGDDITGAQLVEGLEKIERRAVCRGGF